MQKYRPVTGTEGMDFMEKFCIRCDKDINSNCEILAATLAYDIESPDYPQEWCYQDGVPVCSAFKGGARV